jgi:triosephosphate isomerase
MKLIAGNWKMFKGPRETREFCSAFTAPEGVEAVLCPPFVSLAAAVESGHTIFAQNVHWAGDGAYTGEISAPMLVELGVAGSIVGHSERRQYFGETDETVARRTVAALEHGLRVIACVGESLEERESGQMELVLRVQVEAVGDAVGAHERLVIAYEPVWAIGTGEVATPQDAQEVCAAIRDTIAKLYGPARADATRVLYGGSVKAANVAGIMAEPDIDGALVGGASIDPGEFASIVRFRQHVSA